jgi:UvrD-like helicase C-terminal domain/AAA domain
MEYRIADTFTDSLGRLTADDQKAVKTTAFDLQMNLAGTGLNFHRIEKSKDKNFWSVRVNGDIRLIVHKTASSLLLCYVDHHDKAYAWAERRRLETHPTTGAAQLVEIRERVEEIVVPRYVEAVQTAKPLFGRISDDDLFAYGVPREWLRDVRSATEDTILELVTHLPGEAAEALLELATGNTPKLKPALIPGGDPFAHPDAMRRFRIMQDVEELTRALDYPWEKWMVFLHPAQRQWVERDYTGPARVAGSAGTGKTIVALHRAVYLARRFPEGRVLLTTFSKPLANALHDKMRLLVGKEPRLAERLEVVSLNAVAERLYAPQFGKPKFATDVWLGAQLLSAAQAAGLKFNVHFLLSEWHDLVDAWQLETWDAYRDVKRLGRKSRLSEAQRSSVWAVFADVKRKAEQAGLVTQAGMFNRLAQHFSSANRSPFEHIVVDEAQDMTVAQLRFVGALAAPRDNGLFFAGDLGQRIFQTPFSWKTLGVDIRGRSRTLNINYRTSHQIRMQADQLLEPEIADVDGNAEQRTGTISVFNGAPPRIQTFATAELEIRAVGAWLHELNNAGVAPQEIGVFVRSNPELLRAKSALLESRLPFKILDDTLETVAEEVSISTMHHAKGLEFKAVVVMACDDEVIPSQERIESVTDDSDLKEIYDTERQLLYVACTRARDHLWVSGAEPASEFLADLKI